MRRLAGALLAAVALAGCGSPPPDLFEVERTGADRNANVDVVVNDGGSVRCNGKEAGEAQKKVSRWRPSSSGCCPLGHSFLRLF